MSNINHTSLSPLTIIVFALVWIVSPAIARADQNAVSYLAPFVAEAKKNSNFRLEVKVVGNRPNKGNLLDVNNPNIVEDYYAEPPFKIDVPGANLLKFYSGKFVNPATGRSAYKSGFSGHLSQFFSERRINDPQPNQPSQPFNKNRVDSLGIDINVGNGSVELSLDSWGGGTMKGDLHVVGGIMYATFANSGTEITVLISIQGRLLQPIQ